MLCTLRLEVHNLSSVGVEVRLKSLQDNAVSICVLNLPALTDPDVAGIERKARYWHYFSSNDDSFTEEHQLTVAETDVVRLEKVLLRS